MRRGGIMIAGCLIAAAVAGSTASAGLQGRQGTPAGWILPADADEKKNPLPVDDTLVTAGKAVYKDKCVKCHGPGGLGDGPDADPDARPDMDLTNPKRADRNPDGVVFYKVWNGRRRPKMPAFREELNEQQVWSVVAYVQSLRKKP
jgi:mono/diheme cytochrome c family protein